MKTTTDIEKKLGEQPLDNWVSTRKGPDNTTLEYMKTGAVALAMNLAFGPCGWEVSLDRIDVVEKQRVNGAGTLLSDKDIPANVMYNAIAVAVVTVTVHTYQGARRHQDVATGTAFGGKAKTLSIAIDAAVKAAASNAFKRACRFFGPATGLLLQFDKKDRKNIQALIDATSHLKEIEGGVVKEPLAATASIGEDVQVEDAAVADDEGTPVEETTAVAEQSAQPETAEEPVVEDPQTEMFQEAGPAAFSRTLQELVGIDVASRICALTSATEAISGSDANAIHKAMIAAFGKKERALGVWGTVGVTLAKGALVSRDQALAVAQVIEEASLGEGGLDGFLSQFDPAPDPTTLAETPVETATDSRSVEELMASGETLTGENARRVRAAIDAEVAKVTAVPTHVQDTQTGEIAPNPLAYLAVIAFVSDDVKKWLTESADGTQAPSPILIAFHKSLVAQFGKDRAMGIWSAIEVTPGKGVVVTHGQIARIAKILSDATNDPLGLEGWLAQFDKPVEEVAAAAASTAATSAEPAAPDDQNETAHAAEAAGTSANGASNGNGTHGEVVQEVLGAALEDMEKLSADLASKLGASRKDMIQKLASSPKGTRLTNADASGLHILATNRLRNGNVPQARVFEMWKKTGFVWGTGNPTIEQARQFVMSMPGD